MQVVEELSRVKELAPQHGSKVEEVLLFFQDESNAYRFSHVVQLYEEEKQRATAKGLTVPPDGLPDPTNVDGDLNYHLELVDLLGMCAKGPNPSLSLSLSLSLAPTLTQTPTPTPTFTPSRCAKGRNPVTEEYCRRWFSEDDLFRVLSQACVCICMCMCTCMYA